MKLNFQFFVFITAVLVLGWQNTCLCSVSFSNQELITKAQKLIKEYHAGTTAGRKVVKVVYFHGKDTEPFANWSDRLTRTLTDVSNFYKEEFYKYGIINDGIPFEKSDDKYVFHVVKGDSVSQNYTKDSGARIMIEIFNKTKGEVDLSKDHVLIINGLCYQREDRTYVFHSPYFGVGSMSNGICQVADCEKLDVGLLKDTIQRMSFSEMAIKYKECSVAEFNSWYIGGIAHEMGHIFGLPHDYGHPSEINATVISLMGQYGSRHYREYLWRGKTSSFFSSASVLQLISHPIFTQSNKSGNLIRYLNLPNLTFNKNEKGITLIANVQSEDRPYGVIALIRPTTLTEYFNKSYSSLVSGADSMNLEIGHLPPGNYFLKLLFLFPNGATKSIDNIINSDSNGFAKIVNLDALQIAGPPVDIKKLYEKLLRTEATSEVKTKLDILRGILNPPVPPDPKTYQGAKLLLSDAQWEKASVGWESCARNYFTCESEFKFFLEFQGILYSKGLYAHSPSSYVFNTDKKWKRFSALVGLRDFAHQQGSARFTVIGDGKVLYQTPVIRINQKDSVNVDISTVKTLELKADGTEGHNFNSWAMWLNPVLER